MLRNQPAGSEATNVGFDLLWATARKPKRGPRPSISIEATIKASIALADAEGLSAVTMNRVAAVLGVTTMALYRYVPDKTALINLMADTVMNDPPQLEGRNWRDDLLQWAWANIFLVRRHPWLFDIISQSAAVGPNWARWLDAGLFAVRDLPLSTSEMMAVLLLVDGHFRASAQVMVGAKATEAWANNFGRMLQRVAGDAAYPTLSDLIITGRFQEPGLDLDDIFTFGLNRIFDGIEAFVSLRSL